MTKNLQLYVSAFIVYNEKIFLNYIDPLKIWVPIGGHTYKGPTDILREEISFIKQRIETASPDTPYKLFDDEGGYITRSFAIRSHSGQYLHDSNVYFGCFDVKPNTELNKIELFSMTDLELLQSSNQLKDNTINLAQVAIREYNNFVKNPSLN